MAYTKHKHGTTYYITKGSARKKPLICLHGGPGGTHLGLKNILELSTIRKVYLYDQIGAGKSSKLNKKKWHIQTFVEELQYLVETWNIESFDLFGSSFGTTLALEYYRRTKNNKVSSLIFQSPMFKSKDWEQDAKLLINALPKTTQKIIKYCHEIGATDSKVYKDAMFKYYLKHVLRDEKKLKKSFSKKSLSNKELYEYMWGPSEFKPSGTLKRYDNSKQLSKIKVPTLFICGQYDEARPSTVKKYAQQVESSTFKVIKGASHAILAEKKELMLKNLYDFLNN